jgi:hypothetical protein
MPKMELKVATDDDSRCGTRCGPLQLGGVRKEGRTGLGMVSTEPAAGHSVST